MAFFIGACMVLGPILIAAGFLSTDPLKTKYTVISVGALMLLTASLVALVHKVNLACM